MVGEVRTVRPGRQECLITDVVQNCQCRLMVRIRSSVICTLHPPYCPHPG